MSRLVGWLRPTAKAEEASDSDSTISRDNVAKEMEDIDHALEAAGLIMNDDIDGAHERLKLGDSSFHKLGMAVTIFMRSVLGFEKSVMAETTAKLDECEAQAWNDFKKAQKHGKTRAGSKLYPPGTEYELVRAETQLMGAVVGVLHESLIEAMKSFYKLRKAYLTLDAIIESENKILGEVAKRQAEAEAAAAQDKLLEAKAANDDDSKDNSSGTQTPAEYVTAQTTPAATTPAGTTPARSTTPAPAAATSNGLTSKAKTLETDPFLVDNPLDIFVHSGANMCSGLLLLILTLIPPAFSRILSVVGFHGDRERGVRMLWRSTAYSNVNGALAGMVLLAYYNGLLGVVDILPSDEDFDQDAEIVGPPRKRCEKLLETMRSRYPDSRLWRIEEAKMYAEARNLPKAIEVLKTGEVSKMKQVAALNNFELAIDAIFVQDWNLMRDTFLHCLEVNDWSPSLYYYMAGCASVELYRDALHSGDKDEARRQKTKAEEFLRKAPTVAGKKRFMARQMPVEIFLQRKLQKWEARAKAAGIDLADAVGTSPALETSYFWNGPKRMGVTELERALGNLKWERCTAAPEVVESMKKEVDEMGTWALLNAVMARSLGRHGEARALLEEHVLKHDRIAFKGPTKDDYVLVSAIYEMSVIAWNECCSPPAGTPEEVAAYRRSKFDECKKQLEVAKAWEAYLLDARMGMRAQSGSETLKWFSTKMGYE